MHALPTSGPFFNKDLELIMMFCFQDEEGELSECVECWSQRQSGQHQGEETVDAVNPVVIVLNLVVHLRLNSYYCGCPLQNNVDLLTIQMLWIVLRISVISFSGFSQGNQIMSNFIKETTFLSQ